MKAEDYFAKTINSIPNTVVKFDDSWYDFTVNSDTRVEVKSCQLSIKDHNGKLRVGRFDWTQKEHLELQKQNNIWICLILQHEGEFLILGFVRANHINKRYLNLHHVRDLPLIKLNNWIEQIKVN